ncbi:ABC transporter permease [Actinospica sp. MGRD01-02]|uniref:Transport permease protein n=1 Tax=Actinospica acidithermotolerans TaxID=2828514 RepID=A0A941IKI0_9ACTN|nr:ABC transporter permease [Actinospica acidithermotolerans]MBR7828133.1 ABC transporter permease [Actinospica acidithermotolerans]
MSEPGGIVLEELPPPALDPEYADLGGVALAAKYGLKQSGKRPPLFEYAAQLWQRRHFITGYATAKNRSLYSNARLGQLWQLLTPVLNVAVYYFVFGILFTQSRGVPKFLLFLVIGVFLFNFLQTSMINGSRSISDQLVLIRALHFPRACLPMSATIIQLQQLGFSMIIVVGVALGLQETPTLRWLLVIPALILFSVFCNGMAMIVARMGSVLTDTAQLLPFISRTWMYLCGVMYSIASVTDRAGIPHWVKLALYYDPPALFITVVRNCMISMPSRASYATAADYQAAVNSLHQPAFAWAFLVFWALLAGVGGFVYFWKAEEQYGRG